MIWERAADGLPFFPSFAQRTSVTASANGFQLTRDWAAGESNGDNWGPGSGKTCTGSLESWWVADQRAPAATTVGGSRLVWDRVWRFVRACGSLPSVPMGPAAPTLAPSGIVLVSV